MLNIYRGIEDWQGSPDPEHRGTGGPVFVQPLYSPIPSVRALFEGIHSLGIPIFENQNGRIMEADGGASVADMRIRDGRRQSVFRAYVFPHMDQPNLTVLPRALVTRLTFKGNRTIDFEEAIHHTHGVAAHLGGGRLVPKAKCCVADVVFQCWTFRGVGNDFSPDKRTKSAGVTYLATKFYTCEGGLPIIWVTKIIRFNLNGIGGIGTGKADTTTTLGLNHIADEAPTTCRKAKFYCVSSA